MLFDISKFNQRQVDDAKRVKLAVDAAAAVYGRAYIEAGHSDSDGMFAASLVKETSKQLVERLYPEFKWAMGDLIKFNRSGSIGARVDEYFEEDLFGEADFIGDTGEDAPTVSLSMEPRTNRFANIGIKMIVTDMDVERARVQGVFDVAREKSKAAKRGYMQKLNSLVLNGDEAKGLSGVRAVPGALRFSATNGSWDSAGPEDIAADIVAAYQEIYDGSNTVYKPNSIVLPSNLGIRLHELQNSLASDIGLLDRLKKVFGAGTEYPITNWVFDHTMNTASDAGGRAFLLFNNGSDFIEAKLPVDFKPARPKQEALHMEQLWWGRYGGLRVYHPRSIAFVAGI